MKNDLTFAAIDFETANPSKEHLDELLQFAVEGEIQDDMVGCKIRKAW